MEENPRRSPKARGMGSQNPWQQLALTVNPKSKQYTIRSPGFFDKCNPEPCF